MKYLDSLFERYLAPTLIGIAAMFLAAALFYMTVVSIEYRVNSKEVIESHCVNNTIVYRNTLSGSIATAGQVCSK